MHGLKPVPFMRREGLQVPPLTSSGREDKRWGWLQWGWQIAFAGFE